MIVLLCPHPTAAISRAEGSISAYPEDPLGESSERKLTDPQKGSPDLGLKLVLPVNNPCDIQQVA